MVHGHPDWGAAEEHAVIYPVTDLGELAARTGSIDVFHRGGNVLWWDDFEAGVLHWLTTTAGAGAAVALDTARAHFGAQSVKLTTGSSAGKYAGIRKYFPIAWANKWAFELAFSPDDAIELLQVSIIYDDKIARYDYVCNVDFSAGEIKIYHDGGTLTTILENLVFETDAHTWYHLKLIVDLVNQTWWRLLFNDQDVALTAYPGWASATGNNYRIQTLIVADMTTATNQDLWIDDFIVTINDL